MLQQSDTKSERKRVSETSDDVKLPAATKPWIPLALVTAAAGSLGYFVSKIVDEASAPFWRYVAPAISSQSLLALCCLLVLALILMALWLYSLYRQMSPRKFHAQFATFDPKLGVWKHRTMPGYFCPRCKAELLGSPMVERNGGWRCPVCETWAGKIEETR